ncbi:MAG: hypothetical protein FWE95_00965 [Planctomycetaceae bacterium]|nr:hypothetical protein [Planctomycetaceae bacterium]
MKTLHRLCLPFIAVALLLTAALLLSAERVTAQETFAPLLTKDTVLFVHVDLSKVDVDLLKTEAGKLGETLLTNLGFDDRSKRTTLRDLDVELENLDVMIRPVIELITKELGIKEIAFIVDESLFEHVQNGDIDAPYVIAVPWKGKTAADLQTFLSLIPEELGIEDTCIPVGDFLIDFFASPWWSDIPVAKRIFTDWATKALADNSSSPMLTALQSLNKSDEIKAVMRIPKAAKDVTLDDFDDFAEDMPIQIRNLMLFAVDKIEWLAASVPVSDLLFGTEAKDWRAITVKMSNADDAKTLRAMMVDAIDEGIAIARLQAEEFGEEIPPLVFEFMKGYLRTWLPDVEGDTLFLQWKTDRVMRGLGPLGAGYLSLIPFMMGQGMAW